MKKPQFLEIRSEDMHWFKPSRKAKIQMIKNRLSRFLKIIFRHSALPILVAVLYIMVNPLPVSTEPQKYQKLTLSELLDYYQGVAKND